MLDKGFFLMLGEALIREWKKIMYVSEATTKLFWWWQVKKNLPA
jgi:hypothetical protein